MGKKVTVETLVFWNAIDTAIDLLPRTIKDNENNNKKLNCILEPVTTQLKRLEEVLNYIEDSSKE